MDSIDIQDIVEKYNQIRGGLIGMLDEIQLDIGICHRKL